MTLPTEAPDTPPENKPAVTPADYDEYGHEPQQDDEPLEPDEALTDPA